ncbi:hypothetical protein PBS_63170 [Paraburkholderia sp. 2C]
MNEPDFLIASPAGEHDPGRFAIGETGFSFGERERPRAALDAWMDGAGIPAGARDVLESHPPFRDIVGLIGVPEKVRAARAPSSEWILAGSACGLVSMVVRDARDSTPGQLGDDADRAIAAAKRYGARNVVIFVQAGNDGDAKRGREALQQAFATNIPESNRLFSVARADFPVWLASLVEKA